MRYCGLKSMTRGRRLIGAGILAFVFFLPLHQHFFTATPQLSRECSCFLGGRSQPGLGPAPTQCAPIFHAVFVRIDQPQVFFWVPAKSQSIRSPPFTVSA